jgi:hypothetical protein
MFALDVPGPLAATELVDRWRDIGPILWLVAGGTFVAQRRG